MSMPCSRAARRAAGVVRSGARNDSGPDAGVDVGVLPLLGGELVGARPRVGERLPGDPGRGAGEQRADRRRVAGGVPDDLGVVALADRVGESVDPLRAVAHRVPDEPAGRVGEAEAARGGGRRELGVQQVGGRVEPRLLVGREPGERVAVLAVEDPRVADHDDAGARRLGADGRVERVQPTGQGVVDERLGAVDRAVAVTGPPRRRALGEHVGEPRVVAADRDGDVAGGGVQRAELGVGDVGDGRARAGAEVERVALLAGQQAGVGVDRALARRSVVDVGAGAGARGVGVAEGDVRRRRGLGRGGGRQERGDRRECDQEWRDEASSEQGDLRERTP